MRATVLLFGLVGLASCTPTFGEDRDSFRKSSTHVRSRRAAELSQKWIPGSVGAHGSFGQLHHVSDLNDERHLARHSRAAGVRGLAGEASFLAGKHRAEDLKRSAQHSFLSLRSLAGDDADDRCLATALKGTNNQYDAFLETMLLEVAAGGDMTVNAWEKGKQLYLRNNWASEIMSSNVARAKEFLGEVCAAIANQPKPSPPTTPPPATCFDTTPKKTKVALCIQTTIAKVRAEFVGDMLDRGIAELEASHKLTIKRGAAGSEDVTSDIDVNLNGKETFRLTRLFNEKFRERFNLEESGALVDVNVYAEDYLSKPTKKSDAKDTITKLYAGVLPEADANNDVFALFKIRQYTDDARWNAFKAALLASGKAAIDKAAGNRKGTAAPQFIKKLKDRLTAAEGMLEAHDKAMRAEMLRLANDAKIGGVLVPANKKAETLDVLTGEAKITATDAVRKVEHDNFNLWLRAANNLYEKKLERNHANPPTGGGERDTTKKKAIIETEKLAMVGGAITFSNEPMVAAGSVVTVVGLSQICKQWDLPVRFAVQDFVENLGDVFKVVDPPGNRQFSVRSIMKGAKYLSRLGDGYRLINVHHGALGNNLYTPKCISRAPSANSFHFCQDRPHYPKPPIVPGGTCFSQLLSDNFETLYKMKKRLAPFKADDGSWAPIITQKVTAITPANTNVNNVQGLKDYLNKLMEDVAGVAAAAWAHDYNAHTNKWSSPSKNLLQLAGL